MHVLIDSTVQETGHIQKFIHPNVQIGPED